jgi:hypothetical protein
MSGCDRLERRASANAISDTARLALAIDKSEPRRRYGSVPLSLSQVTIWSAPASVKPQTFRHRLAAAGLREQKRLSPPVTSNLDAGLMRCRPLLDLAQPDTSLASEGKVGRPTDYDYENSDG